MARAQQTIPSLRKLKSIMGHPRQPYPLWLDFGYATLFFEALRSEQNICQNPVLLYRVSSPPGLELCGRTKRLVVHPFVLGTRHVERNTLNSFSGNELVKEIPSELCNKSTLSTNTQYCIDLKPMKAIYE